MIREIKQYALSELKSKRVIISMLLIAALISLTGCPARNTNNSATISCEVYSVEGSIGSHRLLCSNSKETYLYSKNKICIYNNGDLTTIAECEYPIKHMTCTEEYIYYYSDKLYRLNLEDLTLEKICEDQVVYRMYTQGDDIFVAGDKEGSGYGLYMYWDNGNDIECICLEDEFETLIKNTEGYLSVVYSSKLGNQYLLSGYVDEDTGKPYMSNIMNSDGSQFSYEFDSNLWLMIPEKEKNNKFELITIDRDNVFRSALEINQLNGISDIEDGSLISASRSEVIGDTIYMLVQYAPKYDMYSENPVADSVTANALFSYNTETNILTNIYQTKDGEQIAGFSIKNDKLYLLRSDGIYVSNLDGENATLSLEISDIDTLAFEYLNDTLFVFSKARRGAGEYIDSVK